MMKFYKPLLLLSLTLELLFNNANAQSYQWAKSIGGSNSDVGSSIAIDAAGNIYTAGAFQSNVDFDPGLGVTSLVSSGSFDIFVTKFDATGKFIWAKSMGGLLDDRAFGIALDASGNIYTTGYFKGTVDFNPDATAVASLTSVGDDDMFVSKLDATGNYVWVKQIGGLGVERGKSICVDGSGNVLTTGYFSGITDFDPSTSINTLSSTASTFDIFVLKLSPLGNYIWARKFGASSLDEGHAITTDAAGNSYVTGEYGGSVDFDPGSLINNLNCAGVYDVFVLKLDASGNFGWAKSLGGQSYDSGAGIALDASGNVYTTGLFGDVCDFDPGNAVVNLTAAGGIVDKDIFISKLSTTGTFVWAKRMGDIDDDWATSIALDGAGNVYSTGVFHGTVDFDPGAGVSNLSTGFGTEIYISKLDAIGNFVFAKQVGGNIDDDATCIKVDAAGNNIYVTGEFQSTGSDFDPGTGVAALNSLGSYDAFILKLSKFGSGFTTEKQSAFFNIYPNPTKGELTISIPLSIAEVSVTVYDALGKVVYCENLGEHSNTINVSALSKGIYTMTIENNDFHQSKIFIKD